MSKRNYYYLVAGLPDLILDGGKKMLSVGEFVQEASGLLHPDDAALFDMVRYPADNGNLLALLEKRDEEFDARGVFSQEALEDGIKSPDGLPGYMRTYIEAHKEGKLPFPELSAENQLTWLYYDEACAHENAFVREWFAFDRDLRNVISALNCRSAASEGLGEERPFLLQRAVIGRNDIAEAILKSNAPDFSLSAQLPWVERVTGLGRDNLVEYEKSIDTLRWDILNDLTTFSYFQIETVLAFTIKLGMVERWQELDEQAGREKFDRLVEELTSGFQLQKEL
ncbi:MAG: DUF2764 family protein [Chitinivibrionales bacterium]|nr:DUF2764 family protein [Chitinivibrionales bacterium]MBD3394012.1 DUF2764 family protein [Chitinivibrionales bacterium]